MIEIEMLIAQILKKKIYYAGYGDRREVDYFPRFKWAIKSKWIEYIDIVPYLRASHK